MLLLSVKLLFLTKNVNFLGKKAELRRCVMVVKRIFSESTDMCVFMYQISSFCHNH